MLKKIAKRLARNIGLDVKRYSLQTSEIARMQYIFAYYSIDLVFDVGANTGQYAQSLRDLGYRGKIVSFEPLSTAYSHLKSVSQKDPLWEIAPQMALGNIEGTITINISSNSYSSSVLDVLNLHLNAAPESAYIDSEEVRINRLDKVAQQYITSDTRSIFLKIDVQGFEKQVLEGATELLPQVHGIQLELSAVSLYKGSLLYKDMIDLIEKLGYELYGIIPGFIDPQTGRMLQMDGIFFRQSS